MRLRVDKDVDALYLRLDDSKIIESEEVSPGVILDFNENDEVVGIEMLYLSKRAPMVDLEKLVFETVPEFSDKPMVVREKPPEKYN